MDSLCRGRTAARRRRYLQPVCSPLDNGLAAKGMAGRGWKVRPSAQPARGEE